MAKQRPKRFFIDIVGICKFYRINQTGLSDLTGISKAVISLHKLGGACSMENFNRYREALDETFTRFVEETYSRRGRPLTPRIPFDMDRFLKDKGLSRKQISSQTGEAYSLYTNCMIKSRGGITDETYRAIEMLYGDISEYKL